MATRIKNSRLYVTDMTKETMTKELEALKNLLTAANEYWDGKEETMPELDTESQNGNNWINALNEAKTILENNGITFN